MAGDSRRPANDQINGAARLGPRPAVREEYCVFADESATDAGPPCYGIGGLVVPMGRLRRFNEYVVGKLAQHGVVGEARWKKVGSSHGLINFAIELWRDILHHPTVRFSAIVVHKGLYRKWAADQEEAFYTTYTFLLRHAAKLRPGEFEVFIDNRCDSYDKRDEVLEIVSNHMLRGLEADSLVHVTKEDSKLLPGLQVADLLTGAITHAHAMSLKPGTEINVGKQILIERMARVAGWNDLYCDTMPNSAMNIWHFPREWRATPETRTVAPNHSVSFVTAAELLARRRGPMATPTLRRKVQAR